MGTPEIELVHQMYGWPLGLAEKCVHCEHLASLSTSRLHGSYVGKPQADKWDILSGTD